MPRKRFAGHESLRRIAAEIRADTERRMAATPPRPGRATVPYTEPGPTMHENFRVLQEEAEGAAELLAEMADILGHVRMSAIPDPSRSVGVLQRAIDHLKRYNRKHIGEGR